MENEIFYHYFTGNNYSLKNLQEGNITFSHINFFNDPCEIALLSDDKPFDTKNSNMRYKYELLIRVFCFSKTFQNPLMWGHYGNSHEGFCVGYDLNDIKKIPELEEAFCFDSVSYSDDIPQLSEEDISKGKALYYKSSEWKAEQEWRAIIRLADNDCYIISESEFLKAKRKWIEEKLFFEKAVDSHL